MVVREATTYDLPDLTNLWLAMAEEKGQLEPDSLGWFDQQFAGMQTGQIVCAGAFTEGRCIGFADGSLVYEPGTRETGLVGRHLFLHPDFRGSDLGGRIMLRLWALARQSGACYTLTHGTPTQRAFEKFLRVTMQPYGEVRIARW